MLTKRSVFLLFVLLLVGSFAAASVSLQTQAPDPQSQKVAKEELDRRYDLARSLAAEQKFEESLKEYLFVFDNAAGVSGYGGVRLSFVPMEIAEIGRSYPPALVALRTRRDAREKLVLAAKADFDVVHELTSLNEYLSEPERNLTLLDKLKTMGAGYSEIREDLLIIIWEQLVDARRYADLKDEIDKLARRVASQIAESAINKDFPASGVTSSPEFQNYVRNSVVENGGRVYETYLAIGRAENADKLAKWMLTFSSDGQMYAQLINRAMNVNRSDLAAQWLERATRTLKRAEDLRAVREAAKRFPNVN